MFADLTFPERGIDVSSGFADQRPGTTPVGVNVVVWEPLTDRGRGGSRPGCQKYVGSQLPPGGKVVQHLNIVVLASADFTLANFDPPLLDPVTGLPPVDDPSSPGPPTTWGLGIVANDPPLTGADFGSRNPGGPGSKIGGYKPRKTRRGGSGRQPNPNTLIHADLSVVKRCFGGSIQVVVTKPPPDPFGWTGQKPAFFGSLCAAPTTPPTTALVVKTVAASDSSPAGTALIDAVALFLSTKVGSDAFATVILDKVSPPGLGTCSGVGFCTGSGIPNLPGTGVGTVIAAA